MKGERNCTYSLTLNAFLSVSQADVLKNSLLAVVHVLGFGQQDAFSLCVLTDDIVGLAHTLSTRLVRKKQVMYKVKYKASLSITAFHRLKL